MPLKSFKTRKELLIPIQDVYLNELQRIWTYNSNLQRNKDLDNWIQMEVACPNCRFSFIERLIGEGLGQHIITADHENLLKNFTSACVHFVKITGRLTQHARIIQKRYHEY